MNRWITTLLLLLQLQGSIIPVARDMGAPIPEWKIEKKSISAAEAYQENSAAVLSLQIFRDNELNYPQLQATASAIMIDEEGLLISSAAPFLPLRDEKDQLQEGVEIKVLLQGERKMREVRLEGLLFSADVALFSVIDKKSDERFPALDISSNARVEPGEILLAIGFPVRDGEEGGISPAIMEWKWPELMTEEGVRCIRLRGSRSFSLEFLGGAVLDQSGKLVGMLCSNSQQAYSEEGSAILSTATLRRSVDYLRAMKNKKRQVYLGANFLSASIFEKLRLLYQFPEGIYVNEVNPNGSAYTGSMRPGDIIMKVNGKQVKELWELQAMLREAKLGEEWRVEVFHSETGGREVLTLYLQETGGY